MRLTRPRYSEVVGRSRGEVFDVDPDSAVFLVEVAEAALDGSADAANILFRAPMLPTNSGSTAESPVPTKESE